MSGGEFDWGGRVRKGIGGGLRVPPGSYTNLRAHGNFLHLAWPFLFGKKHTTITECSSDWVYGYHN